MFILVTSLLNICFHNIFPVLRIAEGEGSAAIREPKRGPHSLDGKVKRNQLNTPNNRYEYSDVYNLLYIHMVIKPGLLRWTHLSGDVCV